MLGAEILFGSVGIVAIATIVFVVSLAVNASVILLSSKYSRLSGRYQDISAIQSAHRSVTPRLGGISIFITLCTVAFWSDIELLKIIMIPATFLFIAGCIEDIGYGFSVRNRLLTVTVSGLLFIILSNQWLDRVGFEIIDQKSFLPLVGIPLTIFVIAGLSNGFNFIDGLNGFSSLNAIVSLFALAAISGLAGHPEVIMPILPFASGILGFMAFNFPYGRIFMGDAGAYLTGFMIACVSIFIISSNEAISPWSLLLANFWPFIDTSIAIYRRSKHKTKKVTHPDRMHIHQVAMRGIEICFIGNQNRRLSNPLATIFLAPFVMAPPALGILFWNNPMVSFSLCIASGGAIYGAYILAIRFIKSHRADASSVVLATQNL